MKHFFLLFCILCSLYSGIAWADITQWKGKIRSDGSKTALVPLTIGNSYQLKVSGTVNLGKWHQQGKPLGSDACFEYDLQNEISPTKMETFRNSMNISVCDGVFHPDHIYLSQPFIAAQSGIHFWIYDIDYSDNSGDLFVEVIELKNK